MATAAPRPPSPSLRPSVLAIHRNYGRQSEYINGLQSLLLVWPKGVPSTRTRSEWKAGRQAEFVVEGEERMGWET